MLIGSLAAQIRYYRTRSVYPFVCSSILVSSHRDQSSSEILFMFTSFINPSVNKIQTDNFLCYLVSKPIP